MIASMDDESTKPDNRLLELSLEAIAKAWKNELTVFDERPSKEQRWFDTWPGEHYRLLAALVESLQASTVIEIGTFTGMGTLAILQGLPATGQVITFDLLPWQTFENTWLAESDFKHGRVKQIIHDISAPGGIAPYQDIFNAADFIFVDGPKDGITEANILENLATLSLPKNPIVFFDDIRVMNMITIWRRIARPKLDISSFGHWSGSGLIDWNG